MVTFVAVFADLREQALAELNVGPATRLLDAECHAGGLAFDAAARV